MVFFTTVSFSISKSSGACQRTEPPFEAADECDVHTGIWESDTEEIPKSARQALPASLMRTFGYSDQQSGQGVVKKGFTYALKISMNDSILVQVQQSLSDVDSLDHLEE
jgi:hypothetical protein